MCITYLRNIKEAGVTAVITRERVGDEVKAGTKGDRLCSEPLGHGEDSNFYSEGDQKSFGSGLQVYRSLLQLKAICRSAQTKDLLFLELFFKISDTSVCQEKQGEKNVPSLVPGHTSVQRPWVRG